MLSRDDYNNKRVVLIFTQDKERISFKNDNLIIKDENGETKLQYSCYKIFLIYIVGPFVMTSGILERLNKYGISIVFFTHGFKRYLTISNSLKGNTELKRKQYLEEDQLNISKNIIKNKIQNQIDTIKLKRDKNDSDTITVLNGYFKKINECKTAEEIMGYEGNASKIYFKSIFDNIEWNGRTPRIKKDIVNLLLDIGYTLMFSLIEANLDIFGFDLYVGNLHKEFYKRKSLVCDLIEPFRPVVDYAIRKMFNLNQINYDDFCFNGYRYSIKFKPSKNYKFLILKEIIEYKEDIYLYCRSYYRWYKGKSQIKEYQEYRINGIN